MCSCSFRTCFNSVSRVYVSVITIISIVAGVITICFGVWLNGQYRDFDELVRGFVVWGPISFGIVLVVTGVFGLIGICLFQKGRPCCTKTSLAIYLIFTLLVWLAVLITAILCLVYASEATYVSNSNSFSLSGRQDKLNTWQMAAFDKCCCDNGWCIIEPKLCSKVMACSGQGEPCACYNDEEFFNEMASYLGPQECSVLGDIEFGHGEYLIGDPSNTSGCGSGYPKQFQKDFAYYVREYVYPGIFIMIGISAAMLVAGTCSCFLVCYDEEAKDYKIAKDQEKSVELTDGTVKLNEVEGEALAMT